MTINRKIITASIAALTMGVAVAASSTPAAAWHHHHGWGGGALVGGLAAGALLGGAIAANQGYGYGGCYLTRRPVVNRWGNVVGYRRVRVCE